MHSWKQVMPFSVMQGGKYVAHVLFKYKPRRSIVFVRTKGRLQYILIKKNDSAILLYGYGEGDNIFAKYHFLLKSHNMKMCWVGSYCKWNLQYYRHQTFEAITVVRLCYGKALNAKTVYVYVQVKLTVRSKWCQTTVAWFLIHSFV